MFLDDLNIEKIETLITTEGTAPEIDGYGDTETSLINENRNPGKPIQLSRRNSERTLAVQKVIRITHMKGIESTDYHIDAWSVSCALVLSTCAPRGKGSNETRIYKKSP